MSEAGKDVHTMEVNGALLPPSIVTIACIGILSPDVHISVLKYEIPSGSVSKYFFVNPSRIHRIFCVFRFLFFDAAYKKLLIINNKSNYVQK
jgi:hypothetical protein